MKMVVLSKPAQQPPLSVVDFRVRLSRITALGSALGSCTRRKIAYKSCASFEATGLATAAFTDELLSASCGSSGLILHGQPARTNHRNLGTIRAKDTPYGGSSAISVREPTQNTPPSVTHITRNSFSAIPSLMPRRVYLVYTVFKN